MFECLIQVIFKIYNFFILFSLVVLKPKYLA